MVRQRLTVSGSGLLCEGLSSAGIASEHPGAQSRLGTEKSRRSLVTAIAPEPAAFILFGALGAGVGIQIGVKIGHERIMSKAQLDK